MDARKQSKHKLLSEAIGALRTVRRGLLLALDDIGDATLGEKDGSDLDSIHDEAIAVEVKLSDMLKRLEKARTGLEK